MKNPCDICKFYDSEYYDYGKCRLLRRAVSREETCNFFELTKDIEI